MTSTAGATVRSLTFTYGADGLPSSVTDSLGREVAMERDAAGRLVRKTMPGGDVVELQFSDGGDIVGIVPPGRPAHTFTYDARGSLASIVPPSVANTGSISFTYDDDGALTAVTRPDETVGFSYDAAGRLSSVDLSVQGGAQAAYALVYDPTTAQITSVTGPGGAALDYTYDGALMTGVAWSGPVTGAVTRTYDDRLAVATESVNAASTIAYTHDDDDHLIDAGDLSITRDADTGFPSASTLGVVTDSWTYDDFGDLTAYSASANTTPLYSVTYERDALGRVTSKTETTGGATHTFAYTYDGKGQLAEVQRDAAVVETYGYDANGNRTSANVGGTSITATYDAQDRLLTYGGASFTFTPSGRLASRTSGGTSSFEYDAAGNLLHAALSDGTDVTYLIDPGLRRIGRDVDGVAAERFLYVGSRPIAQLDTNGQLVSRFVYAGGVAPAYVVRGGAAHRLITDQAGSVRLVVNATTGAVVQRLEYDGFGRVTLDTNPGFQPFGFAGGLYDPETGLVRFDSRDYDATTGRWTAKDPIGFLGLDTNLYRYAGNDPVNLADPSGLGAVEIVAGIFAGIMDVAMLPVTLAHDGARLATALTEAITGVPQPVPPDPNPVVQGLNNLNALTDLFGEPEVLVDTSSTSFSISRLCTSILATLGAGGAAGAERGAVAAVERGALQSGTRAAEQTVARTADAAYRPAVSGEAARAARLAAETAKDIAKREARQAAQQGAEKGVIKLIRPDGGGAGTRATGKPAGGIGIGNGG
jgi:RHS repeat-associated protein